MRMQPQARIGAADRACRGRRRYRCSAGVTLPELLMGLALAVLLMTLTISALGGLAARNARLTVVHGVADVLGYARSEAVMRGVDILVCPVSPDNPEAGCTDARDGWHLGYGVLVRDSGELLRLERSSDAIAISANVRAFVFQPDGSLETAAGGTISVCGAGDDAHGQSALMEPRRVVVSGAGRVRLSEEVGADCG
jgi:Tfp pilus assembly protein FimT